MQFLVTMTLFEGIITPQDIKVARKDFAAQLAFIEESGAVRADGAFADARGGFLVVEADSGEQLWELLGPRILDHFCVKTKPLVPMQTLREFLTKK